ncbi:hypothetical protein VTO42DRAFT_7947 [Malbranchea cinnamomea]
MHNSPSPKCQSVTIGYLAGRALKTLSLNQLPGSSLVGVVQNNSWHVSLCSFCRIKRKHLTTRIKGSILVMLKRLLLVDTRKHVVPLRPSQPSTSFSFFVQGKTPKMKAGPPHSLQPALREKFSTTARRDVGRLGRRRVSQRMGRSSANQPVSHEPFTGRL